MKPETSKRLRSAASITGWVVNVAASLLFVASAFGGAVNPSTTVVGALLAMMFPAFLVLMLLLLAVNLFWNRRLALANVACLLLCISPILTYCPLNIFRPSVETILETDRPVVKVMTFNVLGLNNFEHLDEECNRNSTLDYILMEDADLLLCQELPLQINTDWVPHASQEQIDSLMARYPYRHFTARGMGLMSKYPFEKVTVQVADPNQLDLLRYDVNIDGRLVHLLNLHMQSIGLTNHDREIYRHITEGEAPEGIDGIRSGLIAKLSYAFRARADQARDVRSALDSLNGHTVLLCGDFNDIPGSYAQRTVQGSTLTDAYRQAGLGPAITYHADRLYFRIDQMLYSGNIEARRVWVGNCPSSDHYPLIGLFELTN